MWKLLANKENKELLNNLNGKYAMYSEVYSPKDEFEIFEEIFNYAISENKKVHIVWATLKEELDILEKYYEESGFLREDVNCFKVNFKEVLVTVSVNIENLIWRWSDYKAMKEKIFFVPPIRESWQNKAMFKWINRGSIAWIYIDKFKEENLNFLWNCIKEEKILPLTLSKVLKYNLEDIGFTGRINPLEINY